MTHNTRDTIWKKGAFYYKQLKDGAPHIGKANAISAVAGLGIGICGYLYFDKVDPVDVIGATEAESVHGSTLLEMLQAEAALKVAKQTVSDLTQKVHDAQSDLQRAQDVNADAKATIYGLKAALIADLPVALDPCAIEQGEGYMITCAAEDTQRRLARQEASEVIRDMLTNPAWIGGLDLSGSSVDDGGAYYERRIDSTLVALVKNHIKLVVLLPNDNITLDGQSGIAPALVYDGIKNLLIVNPESNWEALANSAMTDGNVIKKPLSVDEFVNHLKPDAARDACLGDDVFTTLVGATKIIEANQNAVLVFAPNVGNESKVLFDSATRPARAALKLSTPAPGQAQ